MGESYGTLGDEALVDLLFHEADRLPRAAVDEILRRGERMAPRLAAIIDNEDLWEDATERGWATLHATFLLASLKVPATFETILRALERAEEGYDEFILDVAPSLLAAFADAKLEPLRTLLRDRERSEEVRSHAATALVALAQRGPEERDPVRADLRALASDGGEEEGFRLSIAEFLLDLADPRDRELLLSFGDNEWFDEAYVEEVFEGRLRPSPERLVDWLDFYDPARMEERKPVREETPDEEDPPDEVELDPDEILGPDPAADVLEAATADPDAPPPPIRRSEPKVGRNDPCPCGSGAKFKKCCGK